MPIQGDIQPVFKKMPTPVVNSPSVTPPADSHCAEIALGSLALGALVIGGAWLLSRGKKPPTVLREKSVPNIPIKPPHVDPSTPSPIIQTVVVRQVHNPEALKLNRQRRLAKNTADVSQEVRTERLAGSPATVDTQQVLKGISSNATERRESLVNRAKAEQRRRQSAVERLRANTQPTDQKPLYTAPSEATPIEKPYPVDTNQPQRTQALAQDSHGERQRTVNARRRILQNVQPTEAKPSYRADAPLAVKQPLNAADVAPDPKPLTTDTGIVDEPLRRPEPTVQPASKKPLNQRPVVMQSKSDQLKAKQREDIRQEFNQALEDLPKQPPLAGTIKLGDTNPVKPDQVELQILQQQLESIDPSYKPIALAVYALPKVLGSNNIHGLNVKP